MADQTPLLLKVGGALLESPAGIKALFTVLQQLQQQGQSLLLVHGGGCLVEEWLQQAGLESTKVDGLRVTPADQIELVTGALAGAANKKLVAAAAAGGLKTLGLSLTDGGMVSASQLDPRLGQVGQCEAADPQLLDLLLAQGYLPIISSIACDGEGALLNVNADQAAAALAQLTGAKLVLLSDVDGVLDGNGDKLDSLDHQQAQILIEAGVIAAGMKVKVEAALATARALQDSIIIANWQHPQHLLALAEGQGCGTRIDMN